MKKIIILTMAFLVAINLCSCSKKGEQDPLPSVEATSSKKVYEKKWAVNTSSERTQRTNEDPKIESIEFMLRTFVVLYSNDSIVTGEYTSLNENTLYLSDFGVLHISSVSENQFNFILEQPGKSNVTINSNPVSLLSSSENTVRICHTWELIKLTSTDTLSVKNYDKEKDGERGYFTFSQYGTYLTKEKINNKIIYRTGTWAWKDNNQNSFTISLTSDPDFYVETTFADEYSKLTFLIHHKGDRGAFLVTDELVKLLN